MKYRFVTRVTAVQERNEVRSVHPGPRWKEDKSDVVTTYGPAHWAVTCDRVWSFRTAEKPDVEVGDVLMVSIEKL